MARGEGVAGREAKPTGKYWPIVLWIFDCKSLLFNTNEIWMCNQNETEKTKRNQ